MKMKIRSPSLCRDTLDDSRNVGRQDDQIFRTY